MSAKKVIEMLNEVRAQEITAVRQYMGHRYRARGPYTRQLRDMWRKEALEEMRHAEDLAERINALGGDPVKDDPTQPRVEGGVKEMLQADLALEEGACERLRGFIKAMDGLGDVTSRRMLESILKDEEDHVVEISTMLDGM